LGKWKVKWQLARWGFLIELVASELGLISPRGKRDGICYFRNRCVINRSRFSAYVLNKATLQATIAVVLGVACALAGAGFLPSIKGGGVEAIIDKKVSDTKGNITQALAPINLKSQNLKDRLDGQPNFNKMISDRVDTLLKATKRAGPGGVSS
jgi:hypothetical protein